MVVLRCFGAGSSDASSPMAEFALSIISQGKYSSDPCCGAGKKSPLSAESFCLK